MCLYVDDFFRLNGPIKNVVQSIFQCRSPQTKTIMYLYVYFVDTHSIPSEEFFLFEIRYKPIALRVLRGLMLINHMACI